MRRSLQILTLTVLAWMAGARPAGAFALLGPFDDWQTAEIYYQTTDPIGIYGDDIGGPQNLGEEYRYNVPVLHYAFDFSFLDYFGQKGVDAVDAAIKVFNDLPAVSSLSTNLTEYPLNSQRINYRAQALQLLDLKTAVMSILLEELGLGHAERFVWTMRFRELLPGATCPTYEYDVIKRNFDPINLFPSSYVNGTLYTYIIITSCDPDWSEVFEEPVNPLQQTHTSVSAFFGIQSGGFRTGLTRDDVGGLRYLYHPNNRNQETFTAGTLFGAAGGGAWTPVDPFATNAPAATNSSFVRYGVDKVRFVKTAYDSLFGNVYPGATNDFTARVLVGGSPRDIRARRVVTAPDILFTAGDQLNGVLSRTTPPYLPTPLVGGAGGANGPGIVEITAGNVNANVAIALNKIGVLFQQATGTFLRQNEGLQVQQFVWGSFDGSTNEPTIYPDFVSINDLELFVSEGTVGGGGWNITVPTPPPVNPEGGGATP
ncbi:MAG: hypothetical protein ACKVYV_18545 [Limisphaerales bacterium]